MDQYFPSALGLIFRLNSQYSTNVTLHIRTLKNIQLYPDGTGIRTLKTKTQFLRRPFQLSVNKVFRTKVEHFGFKVRVLAS